MERRTTAVGGMIPPAPCPTQDQLHRPTLVDAMPLSCLVRLGSAPSVPSEPRQSCAGLPETADSVLQQWSSSQRWNAPALLPSERAVRLPCVPALPRKPHGYRWTGGPLTTRRVGPSLQSW